MALLTDDDELLTVFSIIHVVSSCNVVYIFKNSLIYLKYIKFIFIA